MIFYGSSIIFLIEFSRYCLMLYKLLANRNPLLDKVETEVT